MSSKDASEGNFSTLIAIYHFNDRFDCNKGCDGKRQIQYSDEREEGGVVPLPDAGTEPNAMMVESTNATITNITVNSSRRAEYMACVAKFYRSR